MARLRTFIAVEATAEIRSVGERLIRKLSQTTAGVRWVKTENIHLTLKFLGEVDEREIHRVCQKAGAAAHHCEPFQITCSTAGAFPSPDRPRTIWMGVNDNQGRLSQVQQRIEESLGQLGFPPEPRKFHGHLTLGRIRYNRRGSDELRQMLEAEKDTEFGILPVDEVVVFSSEHSGQGPTYTVLGRCPFGH
jgi:2'-5' RNA ligase